MSFFEEPLLQYWLDGNALFAECFEIAVQCDPTMAESSSTEAIQECGSNAYELRRLRQRWPDCQRVIQQAIRRKGERQRKPLEVVAFELLTRASPHIDLLTDHRKFVMKGFRVPVLLGEGGIDEAFSNLFSVKGKPGKRCTPPLSECIANLATPLKYGKGIKTWLSFHSVKTIDDVLRLYYGTRCVIAHGVAEITMIEGCLSNFHTKDDLASGMSRSAAAEELRDRLPKIRGISSSNTANLA